MESDSPGGGKSKASRESCGREELAGRLGAPLEEDCAYQVFFNASRDALFIVERDSGRMVDVNPAAEKLFGYPRNELIGKEHAELAVYPGAAREELRQGVDRVLRREYRRKNGDVFPGAVNAGWVSGEGKAAGEMSLGVVSIRDISDREALDEALWNSEKRYRTVAEAVNDAITVMDLEGRYLYVNEQRARFGGMRPEDFLGKSLWDAHSKEEAVELYAALKAFLAGGPCEFNGARLKAMGDRWIDARAQKIEWLPTGEPAVMVVCRDVTERTLAERAVARRDAMLKAIGAAAEDFLSNDDWRSVVPEFLGALGQAADVSRAYVFENHLGPDGTLLWSQRFEWAVSGVSAEIDNPVLQNFPIRDMGFGRWLDELSEGREIAGTVREFPETERRILEEQSIRSIVGAPIMVAGEWWGMIGFDDCRHEREWSAAEIEALRIAGNFIGSALRRGRMTDELILAKREAESASRAKSIFLNTMSHELRTPLNGLLGFSELLLGADLGQEERDAVELIRESGRNLLNVLNDLIEAAKLESGSLGLEEREFPPGPIMDSIVKTFTIEARSKGVKLRYVIASDVPKRLVGDPVRLRQTLLKLVDNAVKFTDRGEIEVSAELIPPVLDRASLGAAFPWQTPGPATWIRLTVRDTGRGIPADKLPNVFASFNQAEGGLTRSRGGAGVGLSIVHGLVERMGGRIEVRSKPGEGTEFRLNLPFVAAEVETSGPRVEERTSSVLARTRAEAAKTRAEEAAPAIGPGIGQGAPAPHSQNAWASMEVNVLQGARVLLVEDDQFNQLLPKIILEEAGCAVRVAENGEQALELLSRERFDCVFMDVGMPVMDGVEATRLIRQGARGVLDPNVPIVAMTAMSADPERLGVMEAGMDDWMPKPIDRTRLIGMAARCMEGRKVA